MMIYWQGKLYSLSLDIFYFLCLDLPETDPGTGCPLLSPSSCQTAADLLVSFQLQKQSDQVQSTRKERELEILMQNL